MIHLLVALRLAGSVPAPDSEWLRHRVGPGETLIDIAARYGVSTDELRGWNPGLRGARVRPGRPLRVSPRRLAPPRERIVHVVEPGDTWRELAIRHGIDSRRLRALNHRLRGPLRPGQAVVIWRDPGQPRTVGARRGGPAPDPDVADGGVSVGRPQAGRISQSVQLPESRLYTRARPGWSWGSTHALSTLQRALGRFREDTGFSGDVVVGSISKRKGGRFEPHSSHQSGRDVDIRLLRRPGAVASGGPPRPDEVDWDATWELVRALLDTGEIDVIFLENRLQRRLYEAARRRGEGHDRLADVIEWADERRFSRAIVRHASGHDGHIHVRFACGPAEPRCRG